MRKITIETSTDREKLSFEQNGETFLLGLVQKGNVIVVELTQFEAEQVHRILQDMVWRKEQDDEKGSG